MVRVFSLATLPLLFGAAPALAQSAQSADGLADAAAAGDRIVVTANRTVEDVLRVGQSVTVLDTDTIERRQSVVVSDLLRQAPGVTVVRNGGVGTATSVNIRGAESDQTVALIDGIKINDPSSPGGGFNFGSLLIGNIARIEVLRGAQSVLWGNQAIGGVVNLITRQPTERIAVNARAEGGWHDTGQVFANLSDRFGPVAASLGGGYFRTDGLSAFRGGSERDGARNYAANGSVTVDVAPSASVDLRGFYTNTRTDIDGFAPPTFAFGDTREMSRTEQWVGYAGLNLALFDNRLRNRFAYARTDNQRRNRDPDGSPVETFRGDGSNDRLEYQGVATLADRLTATFGAEREVSRFTTSSFGGPQTIGRARILGVYGLATATPAKGLTLTGGVRHDDHNIFGGATTFSGNGVFSPNGGVTTVRASYSEGFKAPTLFQLQSEFGNAGLRPERSYGYDAGATQRLADGRLEVGATYFHRISRGLIRFVSCPLPRTGICVGRPSGTYDNVARAVSQGVEATAWLRPVPEFELSASYTLLDARDRSPNAGTFDKRLARRPFNTLTVNGDYRWPFGLAVGATVTAIDDSFDNASNSRRLEGYVLGEVRASYDLTERVQLYGRVENAFDDRYETIFRYGTPGRAGYAGVRLSY